MHHFRVLAKQFKDSFKDVLPIILTVAVFQGLVIQQMPKDLTAILAGLVIMIAGLAVFIYGLEIGVFPLGESIANEFIKKGSLFWLLLFSFSIGFSVSIAEPAIIAVAEKAQAVSSGTIDAFWLRIVIAFSVSFAFAIGVLRIFLRHPIHYYIIGGYAVAILITYLAPGEIVSIAFDLGGVATSTVTVPVLAALAIGLSSFLKGRNPLIDGFGIVALAALSPLIFVQVYGAFVYSGSETSITEPLFKSSAINFQGTEDMVKYAGFGLKDFAAHFFSIARNIIPILLVIFFFQYLVIKQRLPHIKRVVAGFFMLTLGIYFFIVGLYLALFPIGEAMALQLIQENNILLIYVFAFLIGFTATLAEPALIAIATKASEVSGGLIRPFLLRLFVALGVGIGIALGSYRIISGEQIQYFLIPGYILVLIITFYAPKYIIPVAYDSGAVTTSSVTVPLVTALGIGLAANIQGRNPLIDGFGLIAFASLFPMITVMGYGIMTAISTARWRR